MNEETKFPSDLAERFQVRMPKGLRNRIALAANENKRSMNAEILATLEAKYPLTPYNEMQSILMGVSYAIASGDKEEVRRAEKEINAFFDRNPHLLPPPPPKKEA